MRTDLAHIQRCPQCGDFIILLALTKALKALGIPKHMVVVVTGIGCSGKLSQYIDGYAVESLHGRVLPFATGIALANPALTVIGVGGDGDGYGIGLGHFMHTVRRDIRMVYAVCNNENYALTTGQASPTTPCGVKTNSTPEGTTLSPFDPCRLAVAAGATRTKQGTSDNLVALTDLFIAALQHPGFAHIDILQACPSRKRW